MRRTCASDSITHGPAIRNSLPSPTLTGPISNELFTREILRLESGGVPARIEAREKILLFLKWRYVHQDRDRSCGPYGSSQPAWRNALDWTLGRRQRKVFRK